jgi:hypothetical protein
LRGYLNEFRTYLQRSSATTTPHLKLAGGSVRVGVEREDGAAGLTSLRFGGGSAGGNERESTKWETTNEVNVGVDAGILGSRLLLTADYYRRKTNDLLSLVAVPATLGVTSQLQTIGNVENKGVELGLNTVLIPAMMANYGFSSPEFRVLMRRAQELEHGEGDPDHALHTLWGLFASHYARAEHEQAGEVAEHYLQEAEKLGDVGHQVSALMLLGMNRYYRARFDEARRLLERVLELYDPQAHVDHTLKFNYDTLSLADAYLGLVLWVLTWLTNRGVRAKKTGFRDIEHMEDDAH